MLSRSFENNANESHLIDVIEIKNLSFLQKKITIPNANDVSRLFSHSVLLFFFQTYFITYVN